MYRLFAMTPDTHFHIIATTTLSGKVKQRQLLSRQLILKAVHISKNPIRIVFNPVLRTGFPDQPHKRGLAGGGYLIGIPVGLYVFLLHARKMLVQLAVKILPVAVPEGHSNPEGQYSIGFCMDAVIQYAADIFLRVIDKGKDGRHPADGGDAFLPQDIQDLRPPFCGAHMRLQLPAKRLVMGGKRYLDHAFCFSVNAFEQIQIT